MSRSRREMIRIIYTSQGIGTNCRSFDDNNKIILVRNSTSLIMVNCKHEDVDLPHLEMLNGCCLFSHKSSKLVCLNVVDSGCPRFVNF